MPAEETAPNPPLKLLFDEGRYRRVADDLSVIAPRFDRRRFLALTLDGLDQRELLDRLHQTAIAFAATLPGDYPAQLSVLRELAPRIGHNFVAICLSDFVAREGLAPVHFERSLDALKFFTPFGSAEFAIRPFLVKDLPRTLSVMEAWSRDPDEHVRRLASEGSRPRLPWGQRLTALVKDPSPTAPILEQLKTDPALYVRKSVANHLNDITKDHPAWVIDRVTAWDRTHPGTDWIVRHALRSLIKAAHPPALALLGVGAAPRLEVARFTASPARISLGDTVTLAATLLSTLSRTQRLAVDYVLHYARPGKTASAKVFKWTTLDLPPHGTVELAKRQLIRDFSTRRHHAGRHRVELQINGRRLAESAFTLKTP
jgi:3-methyladenine DNA glycosylase AlkC